VNEDEIRGEVREYYTRAARRGSDGLGHDGVWGASRYDTDALEQVPAGAAELSMGCGNPLAMIDLAPGETVLDLGSGGGLDVILSAKRVGPTGIAYGIDELDEMIDDGLVVGERGDERLDGEVVDGSGQAAGDLVDEGERVVGEQGVGPAGEGEGGGRRRSRSRRGPCRSWRSAARCVGRGRRRRRG
jgi:hypothetical protein